MSTVMFYPDAVDELPDFSDEHGLQIVHPGIPSGMTQIPIFIETSSTRAQPDSAVCSKTFALLNGEGLIVSSVQELTEAAQKAELTPAIFVINTFGAKEMLPELAPLMANFPVLIFRRQLFAGQSGLMDIINENDSAQVADSFDGSLIQSQKRSIWYYGAKNADELSRRAATAITKFMNSGDFYEIERGGSPLVK